MSMQRRYVLFILLAFAIMMGTEYLFQAFGLRPEPKKVAPPAAAKAPAAPPKAPAPAAAVAKDDAPAAAPGEPAAPPADATPRYSTKQLTLGSTDRRGDSGYLLELELDQRGASVHTVRSAEYDREIDRDQPKAREPLTLVEADEAARLPFSINLADPEEAEAPAGPKPAAGAALDRILWEVVPGPDGKPVRAAIRKGTDLQGQEVVFRAMVGEPPVEVQKVYRLFPGDQGFELDLRFASEADAGRIAYSLSGPTGVPIEGEWYTAVFRDGFFGRQSGSGVTIETVTANDIAKADDPADPDAEPYRSWSSPLRFAGIEDQYFTVFLVPPPAATPDERVDSEALLRVARRNEKEPAKSDVTVELVSKPFEVDGERPVVHSYRVYAGPKSKQALAPYGADDLASYRKGWSFFGLGNIASFLAKRVISYLLDQIYGLTEQVAGWFGGTRGSYGVAIILLTITVRLMLFPISRKQAISAKKMQDLQPLMAGLKEKYGDDKEKITRETWALYKTHGANPLAGCLPAICQIPIFFALWQTLNNSVALRHAQFLWIDNLAAPDMLFKFPFDIPLVGQWLGPYFNVLPLVVVSLMLVQTKLFSPPATTPEQEASQKMMKYMMVFMMFMFYKVPSGLGLYFITSSLWSIGERKLLPKFVGSKKPALPAPGDLDAGTGGKGGGNGPIAGLANGPGGWLSRKFERLLEEASKDATVRKDPTPTAPRDRGDDRDRGSARPRHGRRR